MKTKAMVIATLSLAVLTSTSFAATRSCTTAMVTLNICRNTSDVAYTLSIGTVDPDNSGPRLAPSVAVLEAFATLNNYQTPSACTPEMVSAGVCVVGQIGQLVPITKAQFADLQIRAFVMSTVRRYLKQVQITTAEAAVNAAPDPDIGN